MGSPSKWTVICHVMHICHGMMLWRRPDLRVRCLRSLDEIASGLPIHNTPSMSGTPENEFLVPVCSFSLIPAPQGAGGHFRRHLVEFCACKKFLPCFWRTFLGPGWSIHSGHTLGAQQNGSTGLLIIYCTYETALLGAMFGAWMALLGTKW